MPPCSFISTSLIVSFTCPHSRTIYPKIEQEVMGLAARAEVEIGNPGLLPLTKAPQLPTVGTSLSPAGQNDNLDWNYLLPRRCEEFTTMTISLYQILVPVYTRQLNNLAGIIQKAVDHCAKHKIDPSALLQYRLFPDMFPLTHQVRFACNHAERGVCRLTGICYCPFASGRF